MKKDNNLLANYNLIYFICEKIVPMCLIHFYIYLYLSRTSIKLIVVVKLVNI